MSTASPPHRRAGAATLLLALCLSPVGITAMAIEEPTYQVLEIFPEFELRRYSPTLVAETEVSGDFEGAGNQAFRRLADFIFGNNVAGARIEMTAPVTQRPATDPAGSQTIAAEPQGDYRLSFVMPARFNAETLPAPKDPSIEIRGEPSRTLAARRYSGRWSWENYRDNEAVLLEAVRAAGLTPVGPTLYARYNAPYVPWFLRRNEVLVEVRDPREGE